MECGNKNRYIEENDSVLADRKINNRILSVCFEPTNRCLGMCPYCLIEYREKDQSTATLVNNLQLLLNRGVLRFGFGGGEPLLRKDIYQLGQFVKLKGAGALLRTSGMYEIDIQKCQQSFNWVDISIDSINPKIFRKCRPGIPLDIVQNNIRSLCRNNLNVRINILITRINMGSINDVLIWLSQVGVKKVRFQSLVPRGRAIKNWSTLSIDKQLSEFIIQKSIKFAHSYNIDAERQNSVSSVTLCIVKPTGDLYIGYPDGIKNIGKIDDDLAWQGACHILSQKQFDIYSSTKKTIRYPFHGELKSNYE